LLPHGQVKTAASPGRPRDEQHLLAAQRREMERPSVDVRQFEIRRGRRREGVTARLRAERPQRMTLVMNEWRGKRRSHVGERYASRIASDELNTAILTAQALGLQPPSSDAFKPLRTDHGRGEYHVRILRLARLVADQEDHLARRHASRRLRT